MLSAYPAGHPVPEPFPIVPRAVLHGVAVYDIDPAPYVRDGTVTQADAEWAYGLRPSVAAERVRADADEAEIVGRVLERVDAHLGLIAA